ncbi:tryptophan--tRNA ligase, partial [Streptococcus suis]
TKRYLLDILERELGPIRDRRLDFAQDIGHVFAMLEVCSQKARQVAATTLDLVKSAMGINSFKYG